MQANIRRTLKSVLFVSFALSVLAIAGSSVFADDRYPSRASGNHVRGVMSGRGEHIETFETFANIEVSYQGEIPAGETRSVSIFDAAFCDGIDGIHAGGDNQDDNIVGDGIDNFLSSSRNSAYSEAQFDEISECISNNPINIVNYDFCNVATSVCLRVDSSQFGASAVRNWSSVQLPANIFSYDAETNLSTTLMTGFFETNFGGDYSNYFSVEALGGFVGPLGNNLFGANEHFVISGSQAEPNHGGEYVVNFGTPCTVFPGGATTTEYTITWLEADATGAGPGSWDDGVAVLLHNQTSGASIAITNPVEVGGNGDGSQRSITFPAEIGDRFDFRFTGVDQNNDIQIVLPISANSFHYDCQEQVDIVSDHQILDCEVGIIAGWVFDNSNPAATSQALDIHVHIDGSTAPTIIASTDQTSEGVGDPNMIYGITGTHRYRIPIPAEYFDGTSREVSIRAVPVSGGTPVELTNSPVDMTCHTRTAVCDAISLPTTVGEGETFEALVSLTNTGTEVWADPSYRYISLGTNDFGLDSKAIPLSEPVPPGSSSNDALNLTAPTTPGTYTFTWGVRHNPTNSELAGSCSQTVEVANIWIIESPQTVSLQTALNPGQDWEVTISLNNSGPGASYGSGGPTDGKANISYGFSRNGNPYTNAEWAAIATSKNNLNVASGIAGWTETLTFPVPGDLGYGERVCIVAQVNNIRGEQGQDGGITFGPATNDVNTGCFLVAEQPYFSVNKGSLWAGGVIDSANPAGIGWCSASNLNTGFIRTVFNGTVGTITEYASFARGEIRGIASGKNPTTDPNRLTFQNSTSPIGLYNETTSTGRCVIDFYNYLNHGGGVGVLPTFPADFPRDSGPNQDGSGQYFYDAGGPGVGSVSLGDINLSAGGVNKQITLIIDGDVTITGNITNDASHVGGPKYIANLSDANKNNDIPVFILVASGKIDIQANVTNLDGLFSARNGGIDTCSDEPDLHGGNLFTGICNNPLEINGAFVADNVHLRRTGGGVLGTGPNGAGPAEVFNHSPGFNLSAGPFISDLLPEFEIVSINDLPPAF